LGRRKAYLDMAKLIEEKAQRDPSENTVALVNLVTEIGPDIAEISRRLRQYKESVRYRYKEKIVKRGFAIKADVDYGALGLTRVVMKLRVSAAYSENAHEIFRTMSDLSYLVAYAGTMPHDVYIVHAGVPTEFTAEFHRFMESLKAEGIFSSAELFDCNWFRVAPMRAECFDFDEGIWDFDWSNPPPVDEKAARATISERKKIDKVDLLLLKELWKDGDRSLMEIQAAIKKVNGIDINYKTLGWHYKNHVLEQRLIRDYSVAWHGMSYSSDLQKIKRVGKHGYLGVSLIVRAATGEEKMALRSKLNRLPFLWSEAAGAAYYSQLFFPLDVVNEALEYLKTLLMPYGERAEIFLLDRREMTSFTIGYNLWDELLNRWTFSRARLLPYFESLALKIGKRSF
jgi:DNA-binding Lrp family transcriptional regulator